MAIAFGSTTAITFGSGVATTSGSNNGAMTLYKAESATISVTDSTISSSGSDRLSVTVSASGMNKFAWSLTSPQTNGNAFSGTNTLTAQDAYGNTASFDASVNNVTIAANSPLTGTVSGLSGGNKLTGPADFVSGVADLTSLGMIYGGDATSGTFTATAATGGYTGTSGSVTIYPGAANAIQSSLTPTSASITADGTSTQILTVTAKDAYGNNLTSGGSTVTITQQSGTGSIGSVTDNGNGTYTATVTSPTATGSGVFVATLGGQPVKSGTGSQTQAIITYTPGSADATQSTLTPTSSTISANGTSTQVLTVTAKDAYGNDLTSGGSTVTITQQSGTGTIGSVTDNGNGTYDATVTSASTAGSGVFVAALGGLPVKSGTGSQTQATVTYSTDRYPVASGTWSSTSTWDGGTIPASTATVTIGSNFTVTVDGNFTCAGITLASNSNPNPGKGTGTLAFNSGSQLTVDGTCVLGSGSGQAATLDMTSGGTLICYGFATSGTGTYTFTAGTGTVELTATNTLPAIFTSFNNLTINGSLTTTTLGGNTTIAGNLTQSAGDIAVGNYTLTVYGTHDAGSNVVSGAGGYTLPSGATLQTQNTDGIGGTITTTTATFDTAAGYTFDGSSPQVTSTMMPATVSNLTISNSTGVTLIQATTVNGTLTVSTGATLNLPSGPLLLIRSGATVSTPGTGKIAIAAGASYVNLSSSAPRLQVETLLAGSDGWRMLAAPVQDDSVHAMFASPFVTQGFVGSTYPWLQPNFLWWDETSQGTSVQAWREDTVVVKLGRGYMYYAFNGTSRPDTTGKNYPDVLPLTMYASGTENPLSSPFDLGVTATSRTPGAPDTTQPYVDTSYVDEGWNLVGNPTPSTINWDAASGWTKTNMDGTIYVWDPADTVGGYKTWNGSAGNLGSGLIAPFQAFWVKANGPAPSLQCSNGVKTTGGNFFGKIVAGVSAETDVKDNSLAKKSTNVASLPKAPSKDETNVAVVPSVLTLSLSASGLQAQTYVMFSDRGKLTYDPYDAFSLVPLSSNYLIFYSVAENGQPAMQIQDLPMTGFGQPLTLPLYIGGTVSGQPLNSMFTIRWEINGGLPAGLNIELMDDAVGKAYNLSTAGELTFPFNTPADLVPTGSSVLEKKSGAASVRQTLSLLTRPRLFEVPMPKLAKTTSASRFRLVISGNGGLKGYLPTTPELSQNYPNPFNPSTNIAFSVPSQSRVAIEVFNVLGQKVSTITDQDYAAGSYVLQWNANRDASGVYFCRMTVGQKRQTIKMLLLR